jgi:DNA mismatch repair protein MutL
MVGSGHSAVQKLLFPERMALSADDASLWRDHAGEFAALGFDIREAGSHAVEIHGTPAEMPSEAMDEIIYGMLDELRDGVFAGEVARRERLAAVMARGGAGTRTAAARQSSGEIAALLEALAATANPSFTPGGKAVMAEMTIDEIRQKLR